MSSLLRSEETSQVDYHGYYHLLNQYVVACARGGGDPMDSSLDEVGFRIGRSVIEKITDKQLQKFKDIPNQVECTPHIKFICKEFWTYIFQKSADEVSTDRKGIFFISVFNFTMFQKLSTPDSAETLAFKSLWYSLLKGLIEGAMKGLAYPSTVSIEPLPRNDDPAAIKISVKIIDYPLK